MIEQFNLACPACQAPLNRVKPDQLQCPVDRVIYFQENGIWLFLNLDSHQDLQQFIEEYQSIRRSEKRGSSDIAYYRDLPFRDRTGQFTEDWKIRARSFQALLQTVITPLEQQSRRSLKVLDLGAGNGWLSYRLAQRGHAAAAVDLQTNSFDGLGAHIYYDKAFLPIQADYNHLPFQGFQVDLVIFNASFHYSTNYTKTLDESLRVLHPDGQIIILDSPIYRDADSGAAMVREREETFHQKYGFESNAIPSGNYLTYSQLKQLGHETGINWKLTRVNYGLSWAVRPIRARLAGRREPAQFQIAAGQRL